MTDSDAAFANFLTTRNAARLESERFNIPGPGERPGSPSDRRMRREHQGRVISFWHLMGERSPAELIETLTTTWDRRTPAQINGYKQRKTA